MRQPDSTATWPPCSTSAARRMAFPLHKRHHCDNMQSTKVSYAVSGLIEKGGNNGLHLGFARAHVPQKTKKD